MKKSTFDFASLQNLYIYSRFTKKKKALTLSYCVTNSERSGKRYYSHPTSSCQPDTDLFRFYILHFIYIFILHLEMNIAMFFKARQCELLKLVFVCACVTLQELRRDQTAVLGSVHEKGNRKVTQTSHANNFTHLHVQFFRRFMCFISHVVQCMFFNSHDFYRDLIYCGCLC